MPHAPVLLTELSTLLLPAAPLLIHLPGATLLRLKIFQDSPQVITPLPLLMPPEPLPVPLLLSSRPPALNASTNVTNASSPGATDGAVNLTVTGGTAPYTFAWSNAATTEDISGLSAGTYNVTITDANGCSTTASATVTENTSPINASTAVTNATCDGAADGAVNLTVTGGTAPYTFAWSNAATTEDISGLAAGNYTVTITDAAGATASASATVIAPPALNASTNVTNASSPGATDGAVNLTVTGGTAPYTFAWSNAATTEDISGLSAGTYNVTITDANGCTTTASATVTENTSPINASTAVTNATCDGAARRSCQPYCYRRNSSLYICLEQRCYN